MILYYKSLLIGSITIPTNSTRPDRQKTEQGNIVGTESEISGNKMRKERDRRKGGHQLRITISIMIISDYDDIIVSCRHPTLSIFKPS